MRDKIITEAKTWLGTPYHPHGTLKGVGVDCGKFLLCVLENSGAIERVDLSKFTAEDINYSQQWMLHNSEEKYREWLEHIADPVPEAEVLPGDIVLYRFGRCGSHAGFIVDWPETIIHAYAKEGVVEARGNAGELKGRVDSFWRVRTKAVI